MPQTVITHGEPDITFLRAYSDVVLVDFDDKQIASFVHNWFRSTLDQQLGIAEKLLRHLKEPATRELARTPLLLTFLCITYEYNQQMPANRSELYYDALDILMRKWAAAKRIHDESVYDGLHSGLQMRMLAGIAGPSFSENRYFFNRKELTDSIVDFLHEELNAPGHLNGDQVLETIEVRQGLLVQRARDAYSFSHLTLQEFLAAEWHVSRQQLKGVVEKHMFDDRWREVLLLAAGRVSRADDFLVWMLEVVERYLTSRLGVRQVFDWIERVCVFSENEQRYAARRVCCVVLVCGIEYLVRPSLALARHFNGATDSGLAREIDDARILARALDRTLSLAHALDHELGRELMLDRYFAFEPRPVRTGSEIVLDMFEMISSLVDRLESCRYFDCPWHKARNELRLLSSPALLENVLRGADGDAVVREQVQEILFEVLGIPVWPSRMKRKQMESLLTYLDACQLIVDCRYAATSVSRSSWKNICKRLFMFPQ